jgi:hypothetical protein
MRGTYRGRPAVLAMIREIAGTKRDVNLRS